jgi:hypothetical protein
VAGGSIKEEEEEILTYAGQPIGLVKMNTAKCQVSIPNKIRVTKEIKSLETVYITLLCV